MRAVVYSSLKGVQSISEGIETGVRRGIENRSGDIGNICAGQMTARVRLGMLAAGGGCAAISAAMLPSVTILRRAELRAMSG